MRAGIFIFFGVFRVILLVFTEILAIFQRR